MSHGPINCGPDTGDTDWRHVHFEVCVEWGQLLAAPFAMMTQEVLDDLMEQDWDWWTGPPCGYYMTGCGRRATPNSGWQASHPAHPAMQAWYYSATAYSGTGIPGVGNTALNPTYVPPSTFWGGGVFLHCVKFDGRAPVVTDIGKWIDFTPYAGFPMKLKVCEIGPQCSYTHDPNNSTQPGGAFMWPNTLWSPQMCQTYGQMGNCGVDHLFGGHYDFQLYSNDPCDCVAPSVTPIVPTCLDTLSCPCGWTPIYDLPNVGEITCESPPTGAGTLDTPQTIMIPAIERKCMMLEDYSIPGQPPVTITPQVHYMWENQPANPALWAQLAWDKVYIVEISGSYQLTNYSIETRAFLPCDIPSYVDPWPIPYTPVTP